MSDWCTIESDPAVFTELISNFGVSDCEVEEVYSMDQAIDSSHGLIFLFKWVSETDERDILSPEVVPQLFFARQVITNACATQAILSVLLNADGIEIGEQLNEFREFTQDFDCEMKGEAISNSDMIKEAHNSFARPEPFGIDESKKTSGKGDAYHFIAFVPFQGEVYEIDGLKAGPIKLGDINDSSWLNVAKPAIEARMARYSASETHFALMSIGKMRSTFLQEKITNLEEQLLALEDTDADDSADQISMLSLEIENLRAQLDDESKKKKKQKEENCRRKHNYIPFIMKLIGCLAEKDALMNLVSPTTAVGQEK